MLAAEMMRQPAREPGHRQDADAERETAEHLHHGEVGADVGIGPRLAGRVDTVDDLEDMASATTSWMTAPSTIETAPST